MRRLAIALFVSVLAWVGVAAQRFEVASVKPNQTGDLAIDVTRVCRVVPTRLARNVST